jgi:hypothetical protein
LAAARPPRSQLLPILRIRNSSGKFQTPASAGSGLLVPRRPATADQPSSTIEPVQAPIAVEASSTAGKSPSGASIWGRSSSHAQSEPRRYRGERLLFAILPGHCVIINARNTPFHEPSPAPHRASIAGHDDITCNTRHLTRTRPIPARLPPRNPFRLLHSGSLSRAVAVLAREWESVFGRVWRSIFLLM